MRGRCGERRIEMIVRGWNDAFALKAFFNELSRRASVLDGDERANLEARIQTARELAGGQAWRPSRRMLHFAFQSAGPA